jgi:hypothetical protein
VVKIDSRRAPQNRDFRFNRFKRFKGAVPGGLVNVTPWRLGEEYKLTLKAGYRVTGWAARPPEGAGAHSLFKGKTTTPGGAGYRA